MPILTRLWLIVLAAGCSAALAQDQPVSSYRLRPERGDSRQLRVQDVTEQAPARIAASLSDDEPAEEKSADSSLESGNRTEVQSDGETEGTRENGVPTYSPSLRPSVAPSPRFSVDSTIPPNRSPALKLSPRSETGGRQLAKPNPAAGLGSLGTVGGALAVVLGLFVLIVWVTRRVGPSASAQLPKEAVEVLGRTTISGQQALQLVRVGNRLLLVALSPQGTATLTEITDPHEVERLIAICQRQRPESASNSFAQTVAQVEREPISRSFVDPRRPSAGSNRPRSQRAA